MTEASIDRSAWCLLDLIRECPEAVPPKVDVYCMKQSVERNGRNAKVSICGKAVLYIVYKNIEAVYVNENRNGYPCAKALGRSTITLPAPELMDVSKAQYIE